MNLLHAIKDLKHPNNMVLFGAVLAPSLAVGLVRFAGGAPASAQGGWAAPMMTPGPALVPQATHPPAIAAAMKYAHGLVGRPISGSVLRTQKVEEPMPDPSEQMVDNTTPDLPDPPEAAPELPDIHLTAVIGSGRRAVAVIQGVTLRIGEEATPGWRITSISARTQSVRLMASDGQSAELWMEDN